MKSKPSFMIEGMQAPSNIQIYIFDKELDFVCICYFAISLPNYNSRNIFQLNYLS